MTKATQWKRDDLDQTVPEDCQSILVCLGNRRFAVIRLDDPRNLWPIGGGRDKLRRLRPGDHVVYKGESTQVRAVTAYR